MYDIVKDPTLVSDMHDLIEIARPITDQINLIYQKFHGNIILDPRDMLMARFTEVTKNFATILDVSVESKDYPEIKGVKRIFQKVRICSNP